MLQLTCTKNPISLNDVPKGVTNHVITTNLMTIYFENEQNLEMFNNMQTECPGKDFQVNLNNPIDALIDCG